MCSRASHANCCLPNLPVERRLLRDGLFAQAGHLQLRFNAGHEFARGEGLDEVVVRAGVDAFNARLFSGSGGKHDDRNGRWSPDCSAIRASRAKPSISGIITSVSTRSGVDAPDFIESPLPFSAVITWKRQPSRPAGIRAYRRCRPPPG